MNIHNKKISILGAVRSGVAAAKLAKKLGAIPFVSDITPKEKLLDSFELLKNENIECEFGIHSGKVYDCELVIISPGIPMTVPVVKELINRNIKIISEIEFASWFCKGNIIAITGTNGKTTTTTLMSYLLNHCAIKCYLAGNIGLAFSEVVFDIKENEYVALEVSSFQLDTIESFKPKYSLLLNITPDHLDRYNNSFEEYISSKYLITKNQDSECYFIFNKDDKNINLNKINPDVRKTGFSLSKHEMNGCYLENNDFIIANDIDHYKLIDTQNVSLRGEHNYANILAVLCVAMYLKLDSLKVIEALKTFPGVEHRLEFVAKHNEVMYVNDSKATNVDAVWYALKSFEQPIILILGGKDKGNDYSQIKDLVAKNVKKIYAIGSSSQKVLDYFAPIVNTEIKNDLEDCIKSSLIDAKKGDVVLLSPACASFDMFNNFEHRGVIFKKAVKDII